MATHSGRSCLEILSWDSKFFGFTIGRVRCSKLRQETIACLLRQCQVARVRCLYLEVGVDDPTTIVVAERQAFRLVDVRMILRRSLDAPIPSVDASVDIGCCAEGDLPALRAIAEPVHRVSRYYADPGFRRSAPRLYRAWIENSCRGYADRVIVARENGNPVGLVTCKVDGTGGRIVLVAVRPSHTGRSIGSAMIANALGWFREAAVREVEVITQARNVPAVRFYEKAGFRAASVNLFYHRWFN